MKTIFTAFLIYAFLVGFVGVAVGYLISILRIHRLFHLLIGLFAAIVLAAIQMYLCFT